MFGRGRRVRRVAAAVLAAVAVLAAGWAASPAAAENLLGPVAIASIEVVSEATDLEAAVVELDGSASFDPDSGGGIARYLWEVVTPEYQWIQLDQDGRESPSARFEVPPERVAERLGWSIEFRLTVVDSGRPALSDSDTVQFRINQPPVAVIEVSAALLGRGQVAGYDDDRDGQVDENDERFTVEGVARRPGEGGNAYNEWHIRAASLLVVDGSASYDPDGELGDGGFKWELVYASDVPRVTESLPALPTAAADPRALSTDEDPHVAATDRSETLSRLPFIAGEGTRRYFVYYRLTVTDDDGAAASEIVKIVIEDFHDHPEAEIAHPESDPAAATEEEQRAGVHPAGKDRYVIDPDVAADGVTLEAIGAGDGSGRTAALAHRWSGAGVEPDPENRPGPSSSAVFTAPDGTEDGDVFTAEVEIADPDGLIATAAVELVVADNMPPQVSVPAAVDTADGPDGGWPVSDPPTGTVRLEGFGFDPDGDDLVYRWEQVLNRAGDPLRPSYRGHRVVLVGADTPAASFRLPEVTRGDHYIVHIRLTVSDKWGVESTDVSTVTIRDGDDDLRAVAGTPRRVEPGDLVQLRDTISSGLVSADALAQVTYQWAYTGIETHPRTEHRPPITAAEAADGYTTGEWFPNADGTYHPTAGGRVNLISGRFPWFYAPPLGLFDSVKLSFELTVAAGNQTDTDTVTVTIAGRFFSGSVDGPDFCAFLSTGGPETRPHDSDRDGIADVCALPTTRRATIARQQALESLAVLWPDAFADALHGPADSPDTQTSGESDSSSGACREAPDDLGDTAEQLAADSCGPKSAADREVAPPPGPVDPIAAARFYSGVVDGPWFCANFGLGGPRLHAHDSDRDGIADVCALPYTRREAAARQQALETAFGDHPQYIAALAASCTALGTLGFGDHPADLAEDLCSKPPSDTEGGQPLPEPAQPCPPPPPRPQ